MYSHCVVAQIWACTWSVGILRLVLYVVLQQTFVAECRAVSAKAFLILTGYPHRCLVHLLHCQLAVLPSVLSL